jgi:hypothetical protein
VAEDVEILSDHLYIMMELTSETASTGQDRSNTRYPSHSRPPPTPRWRLKERDRDLLQAAVTVSAWSWDARATQEGGIDEEAESLQRDMSAACDASMPRSIPGGGTRNRCAYWWTEEIAELRRECALARRRLQRARRKRRRDEEISHCYEGYREKRRALQQEIQNAKARSWMELVESIESDPWGRPYRLVTKKLRPPAPPPLTANMEPGLLAYVIGTLFPRRRDNKDNGNTRRTPSSHLNETMKWSEELRVSQEELFAATKGWHPAAT